MRIHVEKFELFSKPIIVVLLCAVVLAACGNSTTSALGKTKKSSSDTTTTAAAKSNTTNTLHVTTTATQSSQCTSSDLSLAEDQALSVVSAGSTELAIVVEDIGNTKCDISGYPSVLFLPDKGGLGNSGSTKAVPLKVTHSGSSYKQVSLLAGQRAIFYIKYYSVPVDGIGCSIVGSMTIEFSEVTGVNKLDVGFSGCGPGVVIYPLSTLN